MQKQINQYSRITPEQVALIHELHTQGMSRQKIARSTHIAPHLLNEFIIEKAFYFEKNKSIQDKLSEEKVDRIFLLRDRGMEIARISKDVKCSQTTVRKYLTK